MKTQDFSFDLPDDLIASYPLEQRASSRLLCLHGQTGACSDRMFTDVVSLLNEGDLLVFNNTKVMPARLFGHKQTGAKLEALVERVLGDHDVLAHVRCSRAPKVGQVIVLGDVEAEVLGREGGLFKLKFLCEQSVLEVLDAHGHMPLPHYMNRDDQTLDRERYQTVYADVPGAVAAPTAGLHFDEATLAALKAKGVRFAFVTLHVGAGTFQPVKVDDIEAHQMHSEWLEVSDSTARAVRETRAQGKRVVAVGTTSVRSLESASTSGEIQPFSGDSDIFIYPGYSFVSVDALITNFHLPQSTLIMLVSAFAGQEATLAAYQHAVQEKYRFYSYGDAMWVEPALGREHE